MLNDKLDSGNPNITTHLQSVLVDYLNQKPSLTINSLSKKVAVSEPTLRRIFNGDVKTEPNTSTVLNILSVLSGKKSIKEIAQIYSGSISEYLRENISDAFKVDVCIDPELDNALDSQIKYLIFKLAANKSGLQIDTVIRLFGQHGLNQMNELENKNIVQEYKPGYYRTSIKNFQTSQEQFTRNFKAVADFIKAKQPNSFRKLNPIRVNYSESVSEKTYYEILKIQKNAISKIQNLMANDQGLGTIPMFMLVGLDTLDIDSADEIIEKSNRKNLNFND